MVRTARLILAVFILAAGFLTPAQAEPVKVTFLLVNDIYTAAEDSGRGGFARLNAVVKAERAAREHVIYANAGDLISPSLLSGLDQGAHTVALINLAPPDIFTPGNHEFDFGPEVFAKRMGEARFPLFAANLRTKGGQPVAGFKDTEIRDVGGLRIGLMGLAADTTPATSSPGEDLVFAPIFDTAVERAAALRAAGADLVVAVVHADRATDLRLLDSGTFDIILSGHDHDLTLLYDGRAVLAESREEAEYLAAIDLTVSVSEKDGKRRVAWTPDFRLIDTASVTPDPETLAMTENLNASLEKELDLPVAVTTQPLDSRGATVRGGEAAIGNMVTDALRQAVHADVAIFNGGGIRGNREYQAGDSITRREILAELPFGNRTVKLSVTGAQIAAALENGVSDVENKAGRFPQVSGLSFTADLNQPPGHRVSKIMMDGKPLDPGAVYTLATNDYMARGGDGYAMLKDAPRIIAANDASPVTDGVIAYLAAMKTVSPKVEGRITLLR